MKHHLVPVRNNLIERLYTAAKLPPEDIADLFAIGSTYVRDVLRARGVLEKPKLCRPASLVMQGEQRKRPAKGEAGTYPLGMQSPSDRVFCAQCDRLRKPVEASACKSPWCSLKRGGFTA